MLGKLTVHLLSNNYFKMSTEAFKLIYVPKCDMLQPSLSRRELQPHQWSE